MKRKVNISKREAVIIGIAAVTGLFLGWLFFHGSERAAEGKETEAAAHVHEEGETIWTCSMHPQIRMDKPGKCPICGMDLIPLEDAGKSQEIQSPGEIQMTESAMKIADIQTLAVAKEYPHKEMYLLGKVKPDERNIAELTARFGGRIEKLFVNFTGQDVKKGEKLATIYSPALVTAQKELLEALAYKDSNPEFYNAVRSKLRLWDLSEEQINGIEKNGEPLHYFEVLSPISGTVTRRHVTAGDYVKEGSPLFQVTDLSHVWVMFDAYESDLPWIRKGDRVKLSVKSVPGKTFSGQVTFIDPVINPETRVARVRVELDNRDLQLKPDMFVNGVITSRIAENKKELLIPKTAVLWTGKRAIVYVKVPGREMPSFLLREIVLGPEVGEYFVVHSGLEEGEVITVNGVFKIDAAAQLAGKPSMMNPAGGKTSTGHDHGSMQISGPGVDQTTAMDMNVQNSEADHSGQMSMEMNPGSITVDPAFRRQLTELFNVCLGMKDAYVATDPEAVTEKAEEVRQTLDKVDMELLEGDAHMKWMDDLGTMNSSLGRITGSTDIEDQRAAFAEFNQALYEAIKSFGMSGITAYYQYCPMAFGNKGAYWLSSYPEIRNPYFGEAMLSCGENRDTMVY